MQRNQKISIGKAIAAAAAVPVLLYAYAEGPDPRLSGAPGEQTCANCHGSGPATASPSNVRFSFDGGNTYSAGATKRITLTISDADARRWGFEASARQTGDNAQAGTLRSVDANTRVITAGGIQYITHTTAGTRPGTTGSIDFVFEWTAPASAAGDVTFYVAANAANGNNQPGPGDRVYTNSATIAPAASAPRPSISDSGVSNGASFQAPIAPKAWFQVKGTNFGDSFTNSFADGKYPTEMNGLRVLVNDKPAALWFNNGTQINALVPDDTAVGPVQVVVVRGEQRSDAATIQMAAFAPAFFMWPNNQPVATDPNFAWKVKAGTFNGVTTTPAAPGDVIVLWGTGFGPTTPDVAAGQQVPSSQIHSISTAPTVRIGGVQAEYLGGALAPGFAGLYQIAVRVPATLQNGDHTLVAEVGGLTSPDTVKLTVQR